MSQASIDHMPNGDRARGVERPGDAGRSRTRLVRGTRGALAGLAAAAAVGAPAVLAAPAVASSPGITAKLSAPTHTPKVGGEKISITVTKGKLKLSGSVKYAFYFSGQLVSTQPGKSFTNGIYHDTLLWPDDASARS